MNDVARQLLAAAALLLASAPSYAYLDPGTGSIILQGLLAGIAVAIGVARGYWERFKAFFGRADAPPATPASDADSSEESEATSRT